MGLCELCGGCSAGGGQLEGQIWQWSVEHCPLLVSSGWGKAMLAVLGLSQINSSSCSLLWGGFKA